VRDLVQDLRYACRALQHSRAFTAWVVGSLAIGMAVTIAAVAFLNTARDRMRERRKPHARARVAAAA
jgi:hypothetical protein